MKNDKTHPRHPNPERILVIKLSALGDFVQALGAMAAIRRHHPQAEITLLTTKPFVSFGLACGYFDHVITDTRPKLFDVAGWAAVRRTLNAGGFTRVYDLQNNDRSALYVRMMTRPRPDWFGTARGANFRNRAGVGKRDHAFTRHKETLAPAGITDITVDDMAWAGDDIARFDLHEPYALFVPGSAPSRPEKRWPAAHYAQLARIIYGWGFRPVIIGTQGERAIAAAITAQVPEALDLVGETALFDIVALARHAAAAIGNDTGPMHLIGPTGCPSLVLFSGHSDPQRHAPLGAHVKTLQVENLDDLGVDDVVAALNVRAFRQPESPPG